MDKYINKEFYKRYVGHATFQVHKQVEHMVSAFDDKIIRKVNKLGNSKSDGTSYKGHHVYNKNPFGVTRHWEMVILEWSLPASTRRLGISQQDGPLYCMAQIISVGPQVRCLCSYKCWKNRASSVPFSCDNDPGWWKELLRSRQRERWQQEYFFRK